MCKERKEVYVITKTYMKLNENVYIFFTEKENVEETEAKICFMHSFRYTSESKFVIKTKTLYLKDKNLESIPVECFLKKYLYKEYNVFLKDPWSFYEGNVEDIEITHGIYLYLLGDEDNNFIFLDNPDIRLLLSNNGCMWGYYGEVEKGYLFNILWRQKETPLYKRFMEYCDDLLIDIQRKIETKE